MSLNTERLKFGRQPHTIVGLELDTCRLTYGVSPCQAVLGQTGNNKCFNTRTTCQDAENFDTASSIATTGSIHADQLMDSQVGQFHLSINGSPTREKFSTGSVDVWGVVFSGAGEHLFSNNPTLQFNREFSLLTHVNLTAASIDNNADHVICGYGNIATNEWSWCLFTRDSHLKYKYTDVNGVLRTTNLASISSGYNAIRFHRDKDGRTLQGWAGPTSAVSDGKRSFSTPAPDIEGGIDGAQFILGEQLEGTCGAVHFWHRFVSAQALEELRKVQQTQVRISETDEIVVYQLEPKAGLPKGSTKQWYLYYSPNSDAPYIPQPSAPALANVRLAPTRLDPKKGLGKRSKVSVTLNDFPFTDVDYDPYISERSWDAFEKGGQLSKLIARHRLNIQGRKLVVLRGFIEEGKDVLDLKNYQRQEYQIERVDGPDTDGTLKVTAKDPLKRADESKAQAPRASRGQLNADVPATAGNGDQFVVTMPVGADIDDDYESSLINVTNEDEGFFVRINEEVLHVQRNSNTNDFYIVKRGAFFTEVQDHSLGDSVQQCLHYGVDSNNGISSPSGIIEDLLTTYAGVDARFINSDEWQQEAETYIPRSYEGIITEPTGVDDLINEITEQIPCFIWWDERISRIQFRALRPENTASVTLNDEVNILADSLTVEEKHDERVDTVLVFFGQTDPTENLKDVRNYAGVQVEANLDTSGPFLYGEPSIKKIFARFITQANKGAAIGVGKNWKARYSTSPREVTFSLDAKDAGNLWTGDLVFVESRRISTPTGDPGKVLVQIVEAREEVPGHRFKFVGLEYSVASLDEELIVYVTGNDVDFNFRERYDATIGFIPQDAIITCIIEPGAIVGSTDVTKPAWSTGSWPSSRNVTLRLVNQGRIQGKGGDGGQGSHPSSTGPFGEDGEDGGLAMEVTYPLEITDSDGNINNLLNEVFGGGGGGGGGDDGGLFENDEGGGGGGGAGFVGGSGAPNGRGSQPGQFGHGEDGTTEAGGQGGNSPADSGDGGNGGGIAQAGNAGGIGDINAGHRGFGGAAGDAIHGTDNILNWSTVEANSDIRGATTH